LSNPVFSVDYRHTQNASDKSGTFLQDKFDHVVKYDYSFQHLKKR